MTQLTKKERKAEKKQEKEKEHRMMQQKERQRKMMIWTGIVIVVVVIILLIGYVSQRSKASTPGQEMTDQGREHITAEEAYDEYNSTPPTSGPHTSAARWGKHTDPVAYGNQVHNLEHGGVILHYHPDKIQNLDELEILFTDLNNKYPKMMLVPEQNMETTYALTGWTWIDTFDDYDEERIRTFAKKRYNKAPEPNAN